MDSYEIDKQKESLCSNAPIFYQLSHHKNHIMCLRQVVVAFLVATTLPTTSKRDATPVVAF